jgi:hypothetical protein
VVFTRRGNPDSATVQLSLGCFGRKLPRNDTLVLYRCNEVTHEWIVWSPVVGWVERSETQRSVKVACWVSQSPSQ